VNSSANLASWLHNEEQETRCVASHNTQEQSELFSKHQPGGTGTICRNKFLQYLQKPLVDPRGLGRWCSWPFSCNPCHTSRLVVAYRPCAAKVKGLKTIHQQQLRYIQNKGLNTTPLELFEKDLTNQITKWLEGGDCIILLMDVNEHPTKGKFSKRLSTTNSDIYKFLHKCWGPEVPYTHINGSQPINRGYISPEIEEVNLAMLNFRDGPGDHRLLIFDISKRSLLGEFRHKVCRPVSRRLVTSQQKLVERYNETVREQFKIHCIEARLDAVDKMTRYCRYPAPGWLRAMIIKLYKQMTKIRQHAEKKCQKILQPDSNFSPTV
jgi:hypothetical protein